MSARTKSRKRALDAIFAADIAGIPFGAALATETARAQAAPERATSWPYARQILEGVAEHVVELDGLITASANGWTLDRMPAVDRTVLRIAAWELAHNPEVPTAVAIDEAVELAKSLSTADSPRFVNGVLDGLAKAVRG